MTDRFSNFADLAEHYAREIATPDYARAFMEQTELAKLSIEHEPSAAEMPDPEVAQATVVRRDGRYVAEAARPSLAGVEA